VCDTCSSIEGTAFVNLSGEIPPANHAVPIGRIAASIDTPGTDGKTVRSLDS
jgi:hypothetical protein